MKRKNFFFQIRRKKRVLGVGYPVSWAPCCDTWLKFEVAEVEVTIAKKSLKENQRFLFTGFVPTGWAPCCE